MKTVKLKYLYLSIIICALALNNFINVHAGQKNPGIERLNVGIENYENGKYDDAIFNLEMAKIQLSEFDKDNLWSAYFYLGLSYCLLEEKEESKKEFNKANDIIKNKLPDPDKHSPKIVKLFNEAHMRTGSGAPGTYTYTIMSMEFVFVKGGCFDMGDNFGDGFSDENPVHEVCVDDFYIGKYEVTQGQWEEVMGNNPSKFQHGKNYPVENVSWNDVQGFIKKLNNKTDKSYRLLTEAEWEYVARSVGKREKWAGTSAPSHKF